MSKWLGPKASLDRIKQPRPASGTRGTQPVREDDTIPEKMAIPFVRQDEQLPRTKRSYTVQDTLSATMLKSVQHPLSRAQTWLDADLPSTHRLLHSSGWHGLRRAWHGDASSRVDNGNGVATTGGWGLVKLHGGLLSVEAGRDEGGWRWVEGEARSNSVGLLGRWRIGRVASQGGTLRWTGNWNQVALSQQAGAELHVILKVERAASLELVAEGREGSRLSKFLHAADTTELTLRILGYWKAGSSAISAAVVVVRHWCRVRWVSVVMVVCRHCDLSCLNLSCIGR